MTRRRRRPNPETPLQRAIQRRLQLIRGVLCWRVNTSAGEAQSGHWIASGLRDVHGKVKGTLDLVVAVRGRLVLLEVKMPGKDASPDQRLRIAEARANEIVAEVVHSVDEAVAVVEQVLGELQEQERKR